jgi:hypothetical protein
VCGAAELSGSVRKNFGAQFRTEFTKNLFTAAIILRPTDKETSSQFFGTGNVALGHHAPFSESALIDDMVTKVLEPILQRVRPPSFCFRSPKSFVLFIPSKLHAVFVSTKMGCGDCILNLLCRVSMIASGRRVYRRTT